MLLLWQCISRLNAHPDYIAYFNELAGRDPSRVLVTGCDLDCGQDLFRLSRALHERNISQLNLAVWSSADMSRMNLPVFQTPPPFQPVTGWVAISLRSLRMGDVLHTTYPPGAFALSRSSKSVRQFACITFLRTPSLERKRLDWILASLDESFPSEQPGISSD